MNPSLTSYLLSLSPAQLLRFHKAVILMSRLTRIPREDIAEMLLAQSRDHGFRRTA